MNALFIATFIAYLMIDDIRSLMDGTFMDAKNNRR